MGKFNDLPEEIVLDILSRLPTEFVLNCKSACKRWRNVVRLPSFSQIHLSRLDSADHHSGKLSFIFCSGSGVKEFYYTEYDDDEKPFNTKTRMDLKPPFDTYSLVGSCNGLICFNAFLDESVYICNPVTRESVVLPRSEGTYLLYGFGYSSSTNEYKVVGIYGSGGDSNVGIVHVYTLGGGTGWRNAGTMHINMKNVQPCAGAFANGNLHWKDPEGTIILAFHLGDEKFSQFPLPPPCLAQADVPYFGMRLRVLGDYLSATMYYNADNSDIWLLKKNDDNTDFSWRKEFAFADYMWSPFGHTKSGRLLWYEDYNTYSCNPDASSTKMDVSFGKFISEVTSHKNTLVSLGVLGEKDTKRMESGEREGSREETENSD